MAKNDKTVSELDTKITAEEPAAAPVPAEDTAPKKARYEGVTTFVYVGPSLPGGKLKSNTVLTGTYEQVTEYYKEVIAEFPSVAGMIVPVSQLAEAREKSQRSGNGIYNRYQKIVAEIAAKGAEQ